MGYAAMHDFGAALAPFETKRLGLRRAAIGADGVFDGYASLFGVLDAYGDVVAPGAFAATLRRRGAEGVKLLWQHRPEEPIGVWRAIVEDARGLKVTGRLDLSIARAREALSLIRAGALDGLSIGFRTLRAANDRKSGARRLLEIDLMEISIVTFPALPQARIGAAAPSPAVAQAALDQKLARLRMQAAATLFATELRRVSAGLDRRNAPDRA